MMGKKKQAMKRGGKPVVKKRGGGSMMQNKMMMGGKVSPRKAMGGLIERRAGAAQRGFDFKGVF